MQRAPASATTQAARIARGVRLRRENSRCTGSSHAAFAARSTTAASCRDAVFSAANTLLLELGELREMRLERAPRACDSASASVPTRDTACRRSTAESSGA